MANGYALSSRLCSFCTMQNKMRCSKYKSANRPPNNCIATIQRQIFYHPYIFFFKWPCKIKFLLIQIKARQKKFRKTRYNSKLWLFSAFFGPFWHFYYQMYSFRHKIWVLWPFLYLKTLYLKIIFENELKRHFRPLWVLLFCRIVTVSKWWTEFEEILHFKVLKDVFFLF